MTKISGTGGCPEGIRSVTPVRMELAVSWCASCNCTDPSQEDGAALGRVGQSSVAGPSDTTCTSLGPAHPRRDCGNRPVPGREKV